MNNEIFQQARSAYIMNNFDVALTKFTECLQDTSVEMEPGEIGLLYHQIGNCLVKLNDPNEAIHAYSQATLDEAYDAQGSVSYNLGMVYASQNDYEDAATHFQAAASDTRYPTKYKAYTALGNSLLRLGKSAEAGAAFRSAALDEMNPDPTKALLNLGVCFMALDRPMDAIASYENALAFDMPSEMRSKVFANMGQAYVAAGKMSKAVRAFESALADQSYVFNDAANVDYQRAVAAVASGVSEKLPEQSGASVPVRENDLSGLDVSGDGVPYEGQSVPLDEAGTIQMSEAAIMQGVNANPAESDFFTNPDMDFQNWGNLKKKSHKGAKIAAVIIIVLVVLLAAAGTVLFMQGWGTPSIETQVQQLFNDPENSDVYASSVDESSIALIADMIPEGATVSIDGTTQNVTSSEVYATALTEEGGSITYQISMVRAGIGWQVANVSLYFTSQS